MAEPLRGQVARILDEHTLVLNLGNSHGVTPGMRFVIYSEGDEITDPASGESLGKLELVKAMVEASHVQENMTIATSLAEEQEEEERPMVLSAVLAQTGRSAARSRSKLYVRTSDISGIRATGPISKGDLARSV